MDFNLGFQENSSKTFCTIELAQGIGTTETMVKRAASELGITPYDSGYRGYLYSYIDYVKIRTWIINHRNESKKQPVKVKHIKKAVPIEELRKQHPLVTDDRCFNISWFPETRPKVYEEIWNEDD